MTAATPIQAQRPSLPTAAFTRHDVRFTSHGTACAAWHYRPRQAAERGPLVVIGHGFDGVREQRLDAYAERFAQAGLASLVFDYRGFGASDGAPRQRFDNAMQLDDWRAAIACARRLDGVDAGQIALWGTSSSGGHVVRLAAEDAAIKAVVAQVPFADGVAQFGTLPIATSLRLLLAGVRDVLSDRLGLGPRPIPFAGQPGALAAITSHDSLTGLAQITPPRSTWRNEILPRFTLTALGYRPVRDARRVRCPLLVCVADADQLIAPAPAIRMAKEAEHGRLRRYPFGHFAMYAGRGFERVAAEQAEFLCEVLGIGAAVDTGRGARGVLRRAA